MYQELTEEGWSKWNDVYVKAQGTLSLHISYTATVPTSLYSPLYLSCINTIPTPFNSQCLAYKELTEEEWSKWNDVYVKAQLDLNNREAETAKAAELLERDMHLLGSTAIEDKLQVRAYT